MNGILKSSLVATFMLPAFAQASQGPGTGPGTAAPWLQLAMAIAVYGGAGLAIAAGIVGALRQQVR